ncbi:MAG TPA: hypothetical protein VK775_13505 [Chthoniobacterales bacterium]|nr:hypothetical protein [Chthoniobacterales bacterium]
MTTQQHLAARYALRPKDRRWGGLVAMLVSMSDESDSKTYEERAWQYFLQLQPSIADVNAAAELAFRAVDAFDKGLKRRRGQDA